MGLQMWGRGNPTDGSEDGLRRASEKIRDQRAKGVWLRQMERCGESIFAAVLTEMWGGAQIASLQIAIPSSQKEQGWARYRS